VHKKFVPVNAKHLVDFNSPTVWTFVQVIVNLNHIVKSKPHDLHHKITLKEETNGEHSEINENRGLYLDK